MLYSFTVTHNTNNMIRENKALNNIIIRKETPQDYKKTELMTMRAFWNIFGPGCNEHLLVHILRESKDYIPEISRVAELNGEIVGTIMYSKSKVVDGDKEHEVITFGPLCVEPTCANQEIGGMLLKETIKLAKDAGYSGIVFFGEPDYYPKHGFLTCDNFGITDAAGGNSAPFMGMKLNDSFDEVHGRFFESEDIARCEDEKLLEEFSKQFPPYKKMDFGWNHEEKIGRISEVNRNSYTVKFWEKELPAKLKGTFYKEENEEFPLVGDYVKFKYNPYGESIILEICERKSILKRPDQSGHAIDFVKNMKEQSMVANFDYVFIVTSLNDDYSFNRIARYVSITLQTDAIPVVILTKSDMCKRAGRYVMEVEELSDKVRVHAVSALYGIGMDELEEYFVPGTTIVLIGSSGAGKSTLVNAVAGKEIMKTSEIRESDSKGRHTTTHRQLIELDNYVTIIDTPGMREIGMHNAEEGIDDTFEDIVTLISKCRFSDCHHDTEPGCAIKKAIDDGSLTRERYELYLSLQNENSNNYELMKQISKWSKQMKKTHQIRV